MSTRRRWALSGRHHTPSPKQRPGRMVVILFYFSRTNIIYGQCVPPQVHHVTAERLFGL